MGLWSSLETMINGRPEPPLRPVPGLAMHLPPRDDAFVATLDPIAGADIDGLAIGIAYRDAGGRPSLRTIRCHAAYRDEDLIYLHAWCLQRQDWRTFRLDRIRQVYDYTTGEILGSPAAFFAPLIGVDLPPAFKYQRRWRPGRPLSDATVARVFRDGAKVLLFVAMGDDRLHDDELWHPISCNLPVWRCAPSRGRIARFSS